MMLGKLKQYMETAGFHNDEIIFSVPGNWGEEKRQALMNSA